MYKRRDCFPGARRQCSVRTQAGSPLEVPDLCKDLLQEGGIQHPQVPEPLALCLFTYQTTGAVCHWLLSMMGTPFLSNSGTDLQPLPLPPVWPSASARLGAKPPPGSQGCHLEVVDVVFCVKVNALGLFVDGHDRESDINGAMELPLGDLEWRVGRK